MNSIEAEARQWPDESWRSEARDAFVSIEIRDNVSLTTIFNRTGGFISFAQNLCVRLTKV